MPDDDPLPYVSSYRENCDYDYDDPLICDREDYFSPEDKLSPLEEALGCRGVSVYDSRRASMEHDMQLFSCDEEDDALSRALENIGTNILVAANMLVATPPTEDEDVGMIVSVKNSDMQDFGMMISDITSATTPEELQAILANYATMPGATELADACRAKMGKRKVGVALKLVV